MTSKSVKPMSEAELLRFRTLMGEPPVLSSEDRAHFEKLFRVTAAAMKPRNMIDVLNLWHSVCASWFINRYNRHATVASAILCRCKLMTPNVPGFVSCARRTGKPLKREN